MGVLGFLCMAREGGAEPTETTACAKSAGRTWKSAASSDVHALAHFPPVSIFVSCRRGRNDASLSARANVSRGVRNATSLTANRRAGLGSGAQRTRRYAFSNACHSVRL